MKVIYQQGNKFVLKLERGDELVETLTAFCIREKISAGFFVGLGASSYLNMASYDLEKKEYESQEFNETLEIANLTGNVAEQDGKLVIHVHGTFSKRDLSAIAGHVTKLIIGGACEIKFEKLDTTLNRKFDPVTGLNLLD